MTGSWWTDAVTAFGGTLVGDPDPGAEAVDVRLGEREVVLHRWPERATVAQVDLTQTALLAMEGGVFPEPVRAADGAWGVMVDGRMVSGASRPDGRSLHRYGDYRTPGGAPIDLPLPVSSPAPEVVLAAVQAIGRFHTTTASLVTHERAGSASLQRQLKDAGTTWSRLRRVVGDRAASAPEIRRWLRCGNRVLPVATELLEGVEHTATTGTIIHGNIWPVDLLIEGRGPDRQLTGIVGWTATREGSPLIDLAQLAVHSAGWSGALAESVLGAYADTGRITPTERRLLPVVAVLDLLPRVGELLKLAYVDDEMIGHEAQPVLRSGMKMLLTSLENLTEVLAPDTEWTQRKANEGRRVRPARPVTKPAGSRKRPHQTRG